LLPSSFSVGECVRDVSTFPKSARLRKRADFVALQNASSKQTVKGFLIVWQNNDRDAPRLGITASKKIGCAVIRNRIKRFTREVFRHRRSLLPQVDINVIARRESASMDFCSVQRELEKAFSRIGASPCVRAVCS
jgi:ribonuclease P protein component